MLHKDLHIDFASNANNYRRLHGGGSGQPIARAIGLKTYGLPLYVVDATAGLGQDAFVLASLGCKVTLIERVPEISILLAGALIEGSNNPAIQSIIARMELRIGDAITILPSFTGTNAPDIIYLDPMFPQRNKSALVKKDMRILKDVVGADPDADQLLQLARSVAKRRVVVKRSKLAPHLNNIPPHSTQIGKANRFDIYMPTSNK